MRGALRVQHKLQYPQLSCESIDGSKGVAKAPGQQSHQMWCWAINVTGGPRGRGGVQLPACIAFR